METKPLEIFLSSDEIGIKGRLLSDVKWMPKQYKEAFQMDTLKLFERLNDARAANSNPFEKAIRHCTSAFGLK